MASAGTYANNPPRSRQTTTPTPHHSIFTGWMLYVMPNQQCQSIEGIKYGKYKLTNILSFHGAVCIAMKTTGDTDKKTRAC